MSNTPFKALSAMRAVLQEGCCLGTHARIVVLALARRANSKGQCFPSLETISGDTGLSRGTVVKALAELEASTKDGTAQVRLIILRRCRVDGPGRAPNVYRLTIDQSSPRDISSPEQSSPDELKFDDDLSSRGSDLSSPNADLSSRGRRYLPRDHAQITAHSIGAVPKRVRKSVRRKTETELPPGLVADDVLLAWAAKQGLDRARVESELAKFCEHAREKDRRCRDWRAAVRRWLLNARDWQKPAFGGRKPAVQQGGYDAAKSEANAEYIRSQRAATAKGGGAF